MLSRANLRSLLAEWILDEFTITDCGELEIVSAPDGQLIGSRDEYLRRYRARLASLRAIATIDAKLLISHEKVVSILESLPPNESLTYWEARSEMHDYAGVASRLGMISFYGPLPHSDGPADDSS